MAVYQKDGPRNDRENEELCQLALAGLRFLSNWTADVVDTYSWKLHNPAHPRQNPKCPPESEEYARATQYNYTDEEKAAMIEVISMVKGLQMLLGKMETELTVAIRRHVYTELQEFVQVQLREPLRKATKNKKELVRSVLQSIRETCADYMLGYDPQEDPATKGKKHHDHYGSASDVRTPRKAVSPSSTQLYMVRTMLESLISDRTGGKKTVRKDIDGQYLSAIHEFLQQSYFWPALLNFGESLEECCDMSQLWFREFYLEMTMGARIQFPIEMSMPWILTDHILMKKDPALTECLLYLLDLYNDSAQFALTKFRKQFLYDEIEAEVGLCFDQKQFLYDEIEAEVGLCFDQFVYKVSEQLFGYCRMKAACAMLDKRFKYDIARHYPNANWDFPPYMRYKTLLNHRHVQLLGRSVDLNRLVTQRVTVHLRTSLDMAISQFEARDICDIMELDGLITVNKLTHRLLTEVLPGLSDFKDLLLEANHNVSAPYGRITLHVFWELCYDFLPKYCYFSATNRFVPSRMPQQERVERPKAPSAQPVYFWGSNSLNHSFCNIYTMYKNFVGAPHFRVIAKLLGYEGISVVLKELLKMCENLIQGTLLQYTSQLMKVMPRQCKLPRYDYGSSGVYLFFNAQLKDIINYADLRTEVFGAFRELGNAILFCHLLEQALGREEIVDLLHAAPFQNIIPKPFCKEQDKLDQKVKRLEMKYQNLQVMNMVEHFGTAKQVAIAKESDLLTKERLCCGLSLFDMILQRIGGFLSEPVWHGNEPTNHVMNIDECTEFHRLWSALQYIVCSPPSDTHFTIEQLYGEGLQWAGLAMIVLLGQRRRFEALDFSYHLAKIHRVDGKDSDDGKLSPMVTRIAAFEALNEQILSILHRHTEGRDDSDTVSSTVQVKCFNPPLHPNAAT